ncbi:MAG: hypothetical protein HN366_03270 [Deltaproteobacteria bacterium]|jgi:hypothetical protein|nr:hypothetical protein [Deltaproteobacteria bacterium]
MSKLMIDLDELRKLIESDVDDEIIRLKVGKWLVKQATEADSEIATLLDTKVVTGAQGLCEPVAAGRGKCCRGRV